MTSKYSIGYQGSKQAIGAPTFNEAGDLESIPSYKFNHENKVRTMVLEGEGIWTEDLFTLEELKLINSHLPWWYLEEAPSESRTFSPDPAHRFSNPVCSGPYYHDMKPIIYLQTPHQECKRCGFCPDLDSSKPRYRKAYREWLEYRKGVNSGK